MPYPPVQDAAQNEGRPTETILREFLATKGMTPDNKNYAQAARDALNMNAREAGYIPGLSNTDVGAAETQSAPAGRPAGGRALPTPPIPPTAPAPPAATAANTVVNSTDPTTSAQPGGGASPAELLAALAAVITGGAGLGAVNAANRGARVPTAAPPVAPPAPVGGPAEVPAGPRAIPSAAGRGPTLPTPGGADPLRDMITKALQEPLVSAATRAPDPMAPLPFSSQSPRVAPTGPAPSPGQAFQQDMPQVPFNSQSPRKAPTAEETARLRARSGRLRITR